MSRIKIKDRITAEISDIDDKGRGLFQAGPASGLAAGLVPGETAEGEITARKEGKLIMRADRLIKPDPARIQAPCPYFGRCGGCLWQDLAYGRQGELKLHLANKALAGAGIKLGLGDLRPAASQYRHRNRMDFVCGVDGSIGLKAAGRWDAIIDLDSCLLLDEPSSEILRLVKAIARKSGAPFWSNREQRGYWRYVVIREGKNTGERLVLITTSAEQAALPCRDELAAALRPLCTSFLHGINPEVTDLSIPKTVETVFGEPYLHEKVNDIVYRIPPASFFQTNTQMAGELQKAAVEFAKPEKADRVLDLYCGSGFLTLALARECGQVLGLEIDPASVELAKANAAQNGIANADFRAGAAEKLLPAELAAAQPDIIVVDPPRSGLHPSAASALASSGARRIVYVSCNPVTLARDLNVLLANYRYERGACLDLFPHTPHIETVVSLTLK